LSRSSSIGGLVIPSMVFLASVINLENELRA